MTAFLVGLLAFGLVLSYCGHIARKRRKQLSLNVGVIQFAQDAGMGLTRFDERLIDRALTDQFYDETDELCFLGLVDRAHAILLTKKPKEIQA